MNIIGISGPARSGKDTLADLIIEILEANNVKCIKTSFAKQLKLECRDFLQNTIGIDSFTEKDEEKKIIRPFLVTWGTHVRRKLDPDVYDYYLDVTCVGGSKSITKGNVTLMK